MDWGYGAVAKIGLDVSNPVAHCALYLYEGGGSKLQAPLANGSDADS